MVNPQSPFTQSPKIQLACTILSSGMIQGCTRRVSLSGVPVMEDGVVIRGGREEPLFGTASCLFCREKHMQSFGLHMNRLNDL